MTIRNQVKDVAIDRLRRVLPDVAPSLMHLSQCWPHENWAQQFSRPPAGGWPATATDARDGLPVPPEELWASYCTAPDSYLASGRQDIATMRALLADSGAPIERAQRVLEIGCAGGRMIRALGDIAEQGAQVWGVDIWSTAVLWCQDHLHPPFHFATTTMAPHLPFESQSFDVVYCGSVFTHIDDLAEAWFLELHRILVPGGRLYFSLNDHHAAAIFDGRGDPAELEGFYERTGGRAAWESFVAELQADPGYQRFRRREAYMITRGRSMNAHVMWDSEELTRRLSYGFRTCAITPRSYGHQTTVLLERLPTRLAARHDLDGTLTAQL